LLLYIVQRKNKNIRFYQNEFLTKDGRFLATALFLLIPAFALLAVFGTWWSHQRVGTSVSERYFVYLVPFGIMATTLCAVNMVRCFKGRAWIVLNIVLGLSGLLLIRALKMFMDIYPLGLF